MRGLSRSRIISPVRLPRSTVARSELADILARSRHAFIGIALLSAVLNVLLLAGSIYMMLVYDMVLPSRSVPTLVGLFALVTLVYGFQAALDHIRSRLLAKVSATVDMGLTVRVHRLIATLARTQPGRDSLQPMRDLQAVCGFLGGAGPTALIDLPWMFFFIAVLFLLHPLLGLTVLVGALVLVGLTILTDRLSREPVARMAKLSAARGTLAEGTRRHAEVLRALGMERRTEANWARAGSELLAAQERATGVTGTIGGFSKIFRMLLQSLVLTVGALLVMDGRASGGVIFASSILSSRALAPVELAIANWRGFLGARQSWARLKAMLVALGPDPALPALPAPRHSLSVEGLALVQPGGERPTVAGVSFAARAGDAIAVLGPSGCGKSTLARGLVGVLAPAAGAVRLDGAALDQWTPDALGPHIGYLPQDVALLPGTVAQNIARFEPGAPSEVIVAAARLAGVHDLILRLPEGYNTQVGPDGTALSAGQRQRIALARALYRDPFLVVLDEPNSNLDRAGEDALAAAVRHATSRGAIVVVVAHRPAILAAVDKVLLMQDGRLHAYGPKARVLAGAEAPPAPAAPPEPERRPIGFQPGARRPLGGIDPQEATGEEAPPTRAPRGSRRSTNDNR